MGEASPAPLLKITRSAFLWNRMMSMPFWAMLNVLSFILYKEMHISGWEVMIVVALKPISALIAPYWSQLVYQRHDRLVTNLVWANIIRYLPFLFFPWVKSYWFMIIASSIYMILYRGTVPAWMEVFKRNIPEMSRERIFAYGTAVDYLGSAVLPVLLGMLMDGYSESWRWIFACSALVGLVSTFFLWKIPTSILKIDLSVSEESLLKKQIIKPWKESWQLIKARPDFAHFQIGFMFGGAGLMIMQPVFPLFFVDVLKLSFTEMMLAIAVCKGIGYAATSPVWVRIFRKLDIFSFSGLVTMTAAVFPVILLGAQYHLFWLFLAYIVYGIMQAGSELSWHMSGPIFAKEEDSSVYSGTNVLSVGIRGCFAPFLGELLYSFTNSTVVILFGGFLCLYATRHLMKTSHGLAWETQRRGDAKI